jgi:hypothetical protein
VGRKFSLITVALVVFLFVLMAFASTAMASYNFTTHTADHSMVSGSVHDKSTQTNPNPCDSCHIPHGANPNAGFLWKSALSSNTNGGATTGGVTSNDDAGMSSDIKPLCYSCHDGTIATTGMATAFSATHSNHRTRSLTVYGSSGRDCDLCHDPHDDTNKNYLMGDGSTAQNYTGSSKFLKFERSGRSGWTTIYPGGDVCGSCHSGNMANSATAKTHPLDVVPGANTAKSHVPTDALWSPTIGDYSGTRLYDPSTRVVSTCATAGVECQSCHSPHGADPSATYTDSSNNVIHSLNTQRVDPDPAHPTDPYLCVNCH